LEQVGTQLQAGEGLGFGLHPLGQHHRPDLLAQLDERFEDLLTEVIVLEIDHEGAIDLDDVGLDDGDPVEVGMALAHVVQRDQEPALPMDLDELGQGFHVLHAGFEDLDQDAAGVQLELLAFMDEVEGGDLLVDDGGLEVQAQDQLVGLGKEVLESLEDLLAEEEVQLQGKPGVLGEFQQRERRDELARDGVDAPR
jgi:hypothetical protein